jgi:hypothetical protein
MISKIAITSTLAFLGFAAISQATTYSYKHPVVMMAYEEQACSADGHEWNAEDGYCLIEDAADFVWIVRKEDASYSVTIETITTNAHTCSYEANNGKYVTPNKLVSSQPSSIFKDDKEVPAVCEVTVTHNADNSVTVTTNDREACQYFCGMNAELEIPKATEK